MGWILVACSIPPCLAVHTVDHIAIKVSMDATRRCRPHLRLEVEGSVLLVHLEEVLELLQEQNYAVTLAIASIVHQ